MNDFLFQNFIHPDKFFVWHRESLFYDTKRKISERGILVNNEAEIVGLVRGMIDEIIRCIPVLREDNVSVHLELVNGQGHRPDVWVLRVDQNPFFVIEVKKPGIFDGSNRDSLSKIHGQMFD